MTTLKLCKGMPLYALRAATPEMALLLPYCCLTAITPTTEGAAFVAVATAATIAKGIVQGYPWQVLAIH
jgi:hypothetical protein